MQPERKVTAAGVAGAIATIVVWIAGVVWPEVVVPPAVVVALTTILTVGAAYLVPNASPEPPALVEVPHG
jgi:threonine/homoserine/homoserine lactone efflux protein